MDSGTYNFAKIFKKEEERAINMYCTHTDDGTIFSRKIASTFMDGKGDSFAIVITYDYIYKDRQYWVIFAEAIPQVGSDMDLDGLRHSAECCIAEYEEKSMQFENPVIILK